MKRSNENAALRHSAAFSSSGLQTGRVASDYDTTGTDATPIPRVRVVALVRVSATAEGDGVLDDAPAFQGVRLDGLRVVIDPAVVRFGRAACQLADLLVGTDVPVQLEAPRPAGLEAELLAALAQPAAVAGPDCWGWSTADHAAFSETGRMPWQTA